jgi:lipid A ethanolaminephosphotransferase
MITGMLTSTSSVPGRSARRAGPLRPVDAWTWVQHAWRAPRSPQFAATAVALWLASVGNLALWQHLRQLPELAGRAGWLPLQLGGVVALALVGFLSLFAWPRIVKPAATVLLLAAGFGQHFMLEYGIFIDAGMLLNVAQTHMSEARDLLDWRMLAQVLLVCGLPLAWLVQLPLTRSGPWRDLGRTAVLLLGSTALLAGATVTAYRELAPLARNHRELRLLVNPLNSVGAVLSVATKPWRERARPFLPISGGAMLGASYAQQAKPPLFVLVVGETARADHFGLNGYPRDTTPELVRRGVLSWRQVYSCGTSTLASVPCMFSHLGKAGFEGRSADYENLLDVLQAAGLAVLWVDNQAGCKGVCDRVAHVSTADARDTAAGRRLCGEEGECMDELMLSGLDERIAQLPEERRRRGVVLVMHQMGSHGPAYYRRSTPETKRFSPECTSHALATCAQDALVNAYDNSLRYTDHFLASTIDWLQARRTKHDVGMLYLSDHGESLGEFGLFLHGVPYAIAPEVQKHVPMVLWPGTLAPRRGLARGCLEAGLDARLSHDNLYHTVLGLMDVHSPTYASGMDAFASCRGA